MSAAYAEPMTAVADRVPASEPPIPPTGPDGVAWRPATAADVDGITDLHAAMAGVDHPDWAETREEIAEALGHSWVDLDHDTLVAETGGRIVAFGHVNLPDGYDSVLRVFLNGGVHPDERGRGVGRRLLDWQRRRALEMLATVTDTIPVWVLVYAESRNVAHQHLLDRSGFGLARYFLQMVRDLADPIPQPALPDDLTAVTPDDALADPILAARDSAFRDHWGSQPTSAEEWRSFWRMPTLRRDLSVAAVDARGAVGGFVLTQVTPEDFERQGYAGAYIPLIGVVRDHRRRGVAPALIAEVLRRCRADGLEKVKLDVDAENPTGALGLYTGLGFVESSRGMAYSLEV